MKIVTTSPGLPYTPEKEETLVDLWRDEPLLYSTTSKGYSNRNMKYAAVHRIAQHFDTTGNYNVVLRVYMTKLDPMSMECTRWGTWYRVDPIDPNVLWLCHGHGTIPLKKM